MSIPWHRASDSMACPIVTGDPMRRIRGFSLLELMVVLAIIALLLTIAAPRYFLHLDRAKENALKQTLFIVRDALDKYQMDKGKQPQSLDELVAERYLRQRPTDPLTGRADTWTVITGESGILDLHSSAQGKALDGSPYADW